MNNLTLKQVCAVLLLSFLFVGCSKKSNNTSQEATTGESTITNGGINQEGNITVADDVEDQVIAATGDVIKKEIITNCLGEVTVKIREYDNNGNLIKITEYKNVTDKNDVTENPYAVRTYTYDENGTVISRTTTIENKTPITEELSKPSRVEYINADGTGDIVTVDILGTKRTFSYENGVLVSGKAEYKDGSIRIHHYDTDADGKIIKVTVTDTSGNNIETRTFTYDDEGNRIDEKEKSENSCPVTTKYEYF